jgi:RNA polymerase sigma-70 factor (ECF subfamily)
MSETDLRLIQRAQKGDRQAFAALYERYQPAIFNYLYYRFDDPDCAEELTCEVFARMVKNIRGYQDWGQPFLAWLYTIARNLRIDYYRECDKAELVELDETLSIQDHDPMERLDFHLKADCLKKVLRFLTEDQQFVILAKFVEERSNVEIAALMEKPEGAIKSLQHRALATLRRAIEKVGCYEHAN